MSKTSEIDPYWIASMYHNGKTMAEFVQALHDVGLTKDESTILWRIIDAAIDIQPDRDTKAHRAEPERAPNNARDAIAFLQRAVDARIDDNWLKEVRAFLKQATAPVA